MTDSLLKRFLRALWTERSRVIFAGVGALMVWFLLGQKVNTSQVIPVEVRVISADEDWPRGSGLFIRVPAQLALSDVQPRRLELTVKGAAEKIFRLDQSLHGTYPVPVNFLGDQEQVTKQLKVDDVFTFGQVKSLGNLKVEAPVTISLTLTRRTVENLTLSKANLSFIEPDLGQDVRADFEPTMIRVWGPADQARLLRESPDLFQLTSINRDGFQHAELGKLMVPTRLAVFDPQGGRLERMSVESRLIRITLTPKRRFRQLVFEGLEVMHLVPRKAWPAGVDRERPLNLHPDTVKITLEVPEEYFSRGGDSAAVKNGLNVFVDLGEMPFDAEADNLSVHVNGYPEGATVKVEPEVIDVIWNIVEAPESNGESNP